MKSGYVKYVLIALTIIFVCSSAPNLDTYKDEVIEQTIVRTLNYQHYAPKDIDDTLSKHIFREFLKKLDYSKRFLLQEDVDELKKYETSIDDEINTTSFEFFDKADEIIKKRIAQAEKFYPDLLEKPFDFKTDEKIEMDPEKTAYAKNMQELKDTWRKIFKYETLVRVVDQLDMQEKAVEKKDTSVKVKTFEEIEKESREKIGQRYKDMFYRLDKLNKEDRFADYINSILETFDPHTEFFPPKEKEDFDINMSGSLEGIGASLTQRDEYIRVERIIPGSPSWKQGQLKEGDLIMKVAQGKDEPVDVVGMRLDDAVRLIRGKKGTEVRLTVKKVDGSVMIIPIIRDVVQFEETFAKSAVIQDKNGGEKFGYIRLPSFYADFNRSSGRRSSTDMKAEIEKLKNENISGIVVDLRNNGGGSLDDVVEIGGLFIKRGPIVQVHSRFGAPEVRADYDTAQQYAGPLVIMVNTVSASASEILAAAMQDYKRAIIIGGEHTFGKGTVQAMVDLDNRVPPTNRSVGPIGAIKLTIQKFYRINGGTTQLQGVIPDIQLPDDYTHSEIGEKEFEYPLPWDKISPARYETYQLSGNDYKTIIDNSTKRVSNDSVFRKVDENSDMLQKFRKETLYSLNIDKFKEDKKRREDMSKRLKETAKDTLLFNVSSLAADLPEIEADSSKKTRAEAWHSGLKSDIYLKEAMNVLRDINALKK